MKRIRVYDFGLRMFHWLFALSFLFAFGIAKTVDDESPFFYLHIVAGLFMGYLLVFRLLWGFLGTTYARFSSFNLHPAELIRYGKQLLSSRTTIYTGHNPGSSYAALAMFVLGTGLIITGMFMALGFQKEFFEAWHEMLANGFLITVILHLFGLAWHQRTHRDMLYLSMITGKKMAVPETVEISRTRPWVGILLVVMGVFWVGYIHAHYQEGTRTIQLFGVRLQAGEIEQELESYDDDEEEEYLNREDHEEKCDEDEP